MDRPSVLGTLFIIIIIVGLGRIGSRGRESIVFTDREFVVSTVGIIVEEIRPLELGPRPPAPPTRLLGGVGSGEGRVVGGLYPDRCRPLHLRRGASVIVVREARGLAGVGMVAVVGAAQPLEIVDLGRQPRPLASSSSSSTEIVGQRATRHLRSSSFVPRHRLARYTHNKITLEHCFRTS